MSEAVPLNKELVKCFLETSTIVSISVFIHIFKLICMFKFYLFLNASVYYSVISWSLLMSVRL